MPAEMKKIHINGVAYDAEAPVIAVLHQTTEKLKADSASHQDALDTLQAHADSLEAERDQLKVDKAELEKKLTSQPADFQARVDARIALVEKAKVAGVEVKADMTNRQVMEAVIVKADAAVKLDGKSDDYVEARFDACIASVKPDASKSSAALSSVKTDSQVPADPTAGMNRIDAAEAKMRDRNNKSWQKPVAKKEA